MEELDLLHDATLIGLSVEADKRTTLSFLTYSGETMSIVFTGHNNCTVVCFGVVLGLIVSHAKLVWLNGKCLKNLGLGKGVDRLLIEAQKDYAPRAEWLLIVEGNYGGPLAVLGHRQLEPISMRLS